MVSRERPPVRDRDPCVVRVWELYHPIRGKTSWVSYYLLAQVAEVWCGRAVRWDPATQTIVGDSAAQRLLARTPRSPWAI